MTREVETTIIAALIHYGLCAADPSGVIKALREVCPTPVEPWDTAIYDARRKLNALRMTTPSVVA